MINNRTIAKLIVTPVRWIRVTQRGAGESYLDVWRAELTDSGVSYSGKVRSDMADISRVELLNADHDVLLVLPTMLYVVKDQLLAVQIDIESPS